MRERRSSKSEREGYRIEIKSQRGQSKEKKWKLKEKRVIPRETREGWPLLTVETEKNGNAKSTNKRGPSFGWFVGLVVPVQETFILPWLLWSAQ